jgi:two-component system chemotaxis response regulator CheB
MRAEDQLGDPSHFTCPECHGTLWEIVDGDLIRYRCHVGHAYTGEAMLEAQSDKIEDTLWDLLRSHRERAVLARRLAAKERSNELATQLNERARGYEEDAEIMERLIKSRGLAVAPVADGDAG